MQNVICLTKCKHYRECLLSPFTLREGDLRIEISHTLAERTFFVLEGVNFFVSRPADLLLVRKVGGNGF